MDSNLWYIEWIVDITTCISALLLLFIWIYWGFLRKRMFALAKKIPGPSNVHFGNIFGSKLDLFSIHNKLLKSYDNFAKLWIGSRLFIFVIDIKYVELILNCNMATKKPEEEYKYMKCWIGKSLLFNKGDKWGNNRKLLESVFHLNTLKTFIDTFNTHSKELNEKFKEYEKKSFDCFDLLMESTIDVFIDTVIGINGEYAKDKLWEYKAAHIDILKNYINEFPPQRFLTPLNIFLRNIIQQKKIFKIDHKPNTKKFSHQNGTIAIMEEIYSEKPEEIKEKSKAEKNLSKRITILDLLVDANLNGVIIKDVEIQEHINMLISKGSYTAANTCGIFFVLMGLHQDIQTNIYKELKEIFGLSDRQATFADTLEMKYLERCILETLRLYPSVPFISRDLEKDLEIGDYTLPSEATIIINTFKLHRSEQFYPHPYNFNPDNFLPEYTRNRNNYAFIPFGGGFRSCLGQKFVLIYLKILLSTILRNYQIYSRTNIEEFNFKDNIFLKFKEGYNIKIETRHNKQE